MTNHFSQEFQYNNCVSRGICSVNPRTSSLQEIIILYLKLGAYYALKLEENGQKQNEIRKLILNTLSVLATNTDFSEIDFSSISQSFNKKLPVLIKNYENLCKDQNITPEYLKTNIKYDTKNDIIKSIRFGEKEFLKKNKSLPAEIRDFYKILFLLAKNMCINIQDLETFGINTESGYLVILKLLSSMNSDNKNSEDLKKFASEISEADNTLIKELRSAQIRRYGAQQRKSISYSTRAGKAVLVVGSNIRELESILDALKDKDVDIYTHDDMIIAHTFPKFSEYKNLRGQFGQGMENCLLDFATFPGPIILTKHSLFNIENLYRGRLYSTDGAYSKGVISIINNDFSDVIKSALEAKGFKNGKECTEIQIGYDIASAFSEIENKLANNQYKRILIFALNGYSQKDTEYFERLVNEISDDTLLISLSCCTQNPNVLCINACFDNIAISGITELVSKLTKLPLYIFMPQCGRNTVSQMIYFSSKLNASVYVSECSPTVLNPNLLKTLYKTFNIKTITTPAKDFKNIKND